MNTQNGDPYRRYKRGLEALRAKLPDPHDPRHEKLTALARRLRDNIDEAEAYGNNRDLNSERAQIIGPLNRLVYDVYGMSFDELCDTGTGTARARPEVEKVSLPQEFARPTDTPVPPPTDTPVPPPTDTPVPPPTDTPVPPPTDTPVPQPACVGKNAYSEGQTKDKLCLDSCAATELVTLLREGNGFGDIQTFIGNAVNRTPSDLMVQKILEPSYRNEIEANSKNGLYITVSYDWLGEFKNIGISSNCDL